MLETALEVTGSGTEIQWRERRGSDTAYRPREPPRSESLDGRTYPLNGCTGLVSALSTNDYFIDHRLDSVVRSKHRIRLSRWAG